MRKITLFGSMLVCFIFIITIMVPSISVKIDKTTNPMSIDMNTNSIITPKCNVRWFLCSQINSSGMVNYAKEKSFAGFYSIEMMYYNVSYGNAFVNGLVKNINFDNVLSIYAYGFTGTISWNGNVEDSFELINVTTILVRVAYHGNIY